LDRPSPLCAPVGTAGRGIGLEYREDVNNLPPGAGNGIGWCRQTRGGSRRASAAGTYLHPAMKQPNLQVATNPLVRRMLFDGKRAVGVEFECGGVVERAEADREVILSAGAVASSHILQLSGVGAPVNLPVVYAGPPPSDGLPRSVLFAFLVDPTAIPRPPT
jgi:choline dehydrogenase